MAADDGLAEQVMPHDLPKTLAPDLVCPNQRLAVAPLLELKKSKRSFRTREALYFQ